ncbi:MAG: tryptophanase leader peptide [Phycisphaeraceae bacterium]|nr:tryptophanase leader peptide [Phycisphaeraceae bacterium]
MGDWFIEDHRITFFFRWPLYRRKNKISG